MTGPEGIEGEESCIFLFSIMPERNNISGRVEDQRQKSVQQNIPFSQASSSE